MKFFKSFLFWMITIIYYELLFCILNKNYEVSNILNIIIFSLLFSYLFSFTKSKISKLIITFICGFYYSLQCIFNTIFKTYFSISVLTISDQVNSFKSDLVRFIIENIFIIILFYIPFIFILIYRKKIKFYKFEKMDILFCILLIIPIFSIVGFDILYTKGIDNSSYELIFNTYNNDLNVTKFGVLPSLVLDIKEKFNTHESDFIYVSKEPEETIKEYGYNKLELNFSDTNNKNINLINDYIKNLEPTKKNEYTGMFKGYNLIYITAESFSEIGVSESLTPTLYKLVNSGFKFTNFYTPVNLSTIGGEFQSLTGLFADFSILSTWRSGKNSFPYGLANVFKDNNYNTYAYHNNGYSFQDRNLYLKSIGFDNYKGCGNGLEDLINCNIWPESDYELFDKTFSDYDSNTPFLAYYMTVSGHFEYNFKSNAMAKKYEYLVSDLNYDTDTKAYLATQIELDRALENLINKLTEANLLDKTVIVLQADHYPYALDLSKINSVSSYERDDVVEINHNALILWNPNIESKDITKVCMSIDVIPTIYNLFGIEYDSRLFVGTDIFSDSLGLAFFTNKSFVVKEGTYFAKNNKSTINGVDYSYIKDISSIVNNRINMSKLIISTNYYDYLFNKNY